MSNRRKEKRCKKCGKHQRSRDVLKGECRNCDGELEDVPETRQQGLDNVV